MSAVAKADPEELVSKVRILHDLRVPTFRGNSIEFTSSLLKLDHMPRKTAVQIVAAAKHYLLKQAEDLQEQADQVLQSFITV